MGILVQSLRTITDQSRALLLKVRYFLIAFTCIGLGVFFSIVIDSPDSGEFVVSIVVVLALLFIIVNKPLNGFLLLLFFTVFIETWVKIPMGAGIPDLSFSRFAIVFLAIFMLAQAAIGKFRFARPGLVEVFLVLTMLGIALAAPMSIAPAPIGVAQWSITMFFTPMVAYFIAKNLVQDRKELHQVLLVIALIGFVSGVYAAYEHATGHVLFLEKGKELHRFYRGSGIRLIIGIMGGSGEMGRALAMTIPVTFYLFLEHKKMDLGKAFLGVMLAAQTYGILIAMSRTPWYALMIAFFIMQFFYPQFRKLFIVLVFVAGIVIWATWDRVEQSTVASRVNDKVSTLEGREVRWEAAQQMWLRSPVRGWGFGHYEAKSGQFRTDGSWANIDAVESDFWHILVGSGLAGFLPYILFIGAILFYSARLFFRARAPDWSGFIKPETLTVVWALLICLLLTSYTAKQVQPVIRLMAFSACGAIVGTHEHMLRKKKTAESQSSPYQIDPHASEIHAR